VSLDIDRKVGYVTPVLKKKTYCEYLMGKGKCLNRRCSALHSAIWTTQFVHQLFYWQPHYYTFLVYFRISVPDPAHLFVLRKEICDKDCPSSAGQQHFEQEAWTATRSLAGCQILWKQL